MVSNSSFQKYGDSLELLGTAEELLGTAAEELLDSTSVTLESSDDRVQEELLGTAAELEEATAISLLEDSCVIVLLESESLRDVLESSISMGSSQIVSPPSHATRNPATANAMAIFAMKDADVCRAVLMRMGTS
jgi:hypothetical protein